MTEHVFAIPLAYTGRYLRYPPRVVVTTPALNPVNVRISVIGTGFENTTTVTRYQHASIALPPSVRLISAGKSNATVRVISSGVISVHCIDNEYHGGDGFLVLPTTQLGKQYYAVTYKPFSVSHPSFVCVSALDQETSVDITTKAGQTFQVMLARYESYRFNGRDYDLTGAFIEGTNPVAVISGVHTQVPEDASYADALISQMLPINSWKYSYVISSFFGRSSGYIYRILPSNQTVTANISGHGSVQMKANEWFEGDVSGDNLM